MGAVRQVRHGFNRPADAMPRPHEADESQNQGLRPEAQALAYRGRLPIGVTARRIGAVRDHADHACRYARLPNQARKHFGHRQHDVGARHRAS